MIEDVQTARELLSAALDRYITACSVIITGYGPSRTLKSISQEISDAVQQELDIIASYHTKLTHAQLMINRTMNDLPTHTPIHMLPSGILSDIFQLVRDAQPDYFDENRSRFAQTYPETLSYVCSRWRRVTIDSPRLWTYIRMSDSTCTYPHSKLLARAKVFAARSDPLPVDVRVLGCTHGCYDSGLDEYFASIATRIRSFDMSEVDSFYYRTPALQSWLERCEPGSLHELVLKRHTGYNDFQMIGASESPYGSSGLQIGMSHENLEERLRPIKVLQLTGVFFNWASQAYHGLVDLRLIPLPGEGLPISQSELKSILTASPRLRELHFGLQIVNIIPNKSREVVRLDDLEVVNLCSMKSPGHYGPLLQLLAPGRKPLQLSIKYRLTTSTPFPGKDAIEFSARSNVSKLHIECFDPVNTGTCQPLVLLELLRHFPTLGALSLQRFYLGPNQDATDGDQLQDHEPPFRGHRTELELHPPPQLDLVHLRDCTVDLDDLRKVIRAVPVQRLKYRECWFYSMDDGYSSEFEYSQPEGLGDTFSYVSSSWPLDELDPWA